jgi:hypothetical protein
LVKNPFLLKNLEIRLLWVIVSHKTTLCSAHFNKCHVVSSLWRLRAAGVLWAASKLAAAPDANGETFIEI